jgi:hypothetical protein
MSRRALAAPLLLAVMLTAGCGGSGDAAPAAAETAAPAITTTSVPVATLTEDTGKPATKGSGKPTVAPEVVAPASTTDPKSERLLSGDWKDQVVTELGRVDARLVADQPAAIKKVRATCKQMETGMFSTKVIPIIQKRFSSPTFTVSPEMAQDIYSVLIQDACYYMNES